MIKLELENQEYVEFEENDLTYFYGFNQKIKQKLVRSLKRFSTGKSLSELEELVYGDDGIEIYKGDKKLKKSEINFLFLQDNHSIYQEVDFLKKSMMFDYFQEISEEMMIAEGVEKINDTLLNLEILFNKQLENVSDSISVNLKSINIETLLKNHLFLSFHDDKHDYPLEMMDSNELLDEYLKLLEAKIVRENKETWLILINPESFLITDNIKYFINELKEISQKTQLLKIMTISNRVLELEYQLNDLPRTVLLLDKVHLLPEFEILKGSIERNYPSSKEWCEEDLVSSFYDLIDVLGTTGNKAENMVLLKVLNNLLGFENLEYSYKESKFSEAEKQFLFS
jgi:hypothetical protein